MSKVGGKSTSSGVSIVDEKLKQYRELQEETQKLLIQKQQVLSQFNENTLVKGELDLLDNDSKVYKLVGPLLMTVDLDDSKQNVEKRLQLIETELKKIDNNILAKQKEVETLGDEIAKLQQQLQADAALAAKQVAGLVDK